MRPIWQNSKECLYFQHFRLHSNRVNCPQGFTVSHNLDEKAWFLHSLHSGSQFLYKAWPFADTYSMSLCIWEYVNVHAVMFTYYLFLLTRQDNWFECDRAVFYLISVVMHSIWPLLCTAQMKREALCILKKWEHNPTFFFCPFSALSRISNIQWVLALIFQKCAAWQGTISLRVECGNQMQWCVKASSSNSPLTEGYVCVRACMHTSVYVFGVFSMTILDMRSCRTATA